MLLYDNRPATVGDLDAYGDDALTLRRRFVALLPSDAEWIARDSVLFVPLVGRLLMRPTVTLNNVLRIAAALIAISDGRNYVINPQPSPWPGPSQLDQERRLTPGWIHSVPPPTE